MSRAKSGRVAVIRVSRGVRIQLIIVGRQAEPWGTPRRSIKMPTRYTERPRLQIAAIIKTDQAKIPDNFVSNYTDLVCFIQRER